MKRNEMTKHMTKPSLMINVDYMMTLGNKKIKYLLT